MALARRAREPGFTSLAGPHEFDRQLARGFRSAAVLALFAPSNAPRQHQATGEGTTDSAGDATEGSAGDGTKGSAGDEVDLFLVQRSTTLRDHPGQISLPGGRLEPGEGIIEAALRETHEEIGLHPEGAKVLGTLPPALVPVSGFVVTPVLAWTEQVGFERAQPGEVLHCLRVAVRDLLDPQQRRSVEVSGLSNFRSPGFWLPVGWVWGFTASLLDHLFTELGWTRPWDPERRYVMSWDEARGRLTEPIPDEPEPPPVERPDAWQGVRREE